MSQIAARVNFCCFSLSIFSVFQLALASMPQKSIRTQLRDHCDVLVNFLLAPNCDDNNSDDEEPLFTLRASVTNQRHVMDCLTFKLFNQSWRSSKTFIYPLRNLLLRQIYSCHFLHETFPRLLISPKIKPQSLALSHLAAPQNLFHSPSSPYPSSHFLFAAVTWQSFISQMLHVPFQWRSSQEMPLPLNGYISQGDLWCILSMPAVVGRKHLLSLKTNYKLVISLP